MNARSRTKSKHVLPYLRTSFAGGRPSRCRSIRQRCVLRIIACGFAGVNKNRPLGVITPVSRAWARAVPGYRRKSHQPPCTPCGRETSGTQRSPCRLPVPMLAQPDPDDDLVPHRGMRGLPAKSARDPRTTAEPHRQSTTLRLPHYRKSQQVHPSPSGWRIGPTSWRSLAWLRKPDGPAQITQNRIANGIKSQQNLAVHAPPVDTRMNTPLPKAGPVLRRNNNLLHPLHRPPDTHERSSSIVQPSAAIDCGVKPSAVAA